MAEAICKGASSVNGVECMAFPIESPDAEYVKESKCVILGTPVYYASMSGTVKMWFEKTRGQFGLQGKLAGAFAYRISPQSTASITNAQRCQASQSRSPGKQGRNLRFFPSNPEKESRMSCLVPIKC